MTQEQLQAVAAAFTELVRTWEKRPGFHEFEERITRRRSRSPPARADAAAPETEGTANRFHVKLYARILMGAKMGILSTQEAADLLGLSRRRVQALIRAGRLPATRLGRDWLIQGRDLPRVAVRTPGRPKKKAKKPKKTAQLT